MTIDEDWTKERIEQRLKEIEKTIGEIRIIMKG